MFDSSIATKSAMAMKTSTGSKSSRDVSVAYRKTRSCESHVIYLHTCLHCGPLELTQLPSLSNFLQMRWIGGVYLDLGNVGLRHGQHRNLVERRKMVRCGGARLGVCGEVK